MIILYWEFDSLVIIPLLDFDPIFKLFLGNEIERESENDIMEEQSFSSENGAISGMVRRIPPLYHFHMNWDHCNYFRLIAAWR